LKTPTYFKEVLSKQNIHYNKFTFRHFNNIQKLMTSSIRVVIPIV